MTSPDAAAPDTTSVNPDHAVVWATADGGQVAVIEFLGDDATSTAAAIVAGDLPAWWPQQGLTPQALGTPDDGSDENVEVAVRVAVRPANASSCTRAESDLGLFAAEWLDNLVAVHAALLGLDGHVVLVPGSSFAGKTSLCVAAAAAGHEVYADEYALIDPTTATVIGWPRRLRVRLEGGGIDRPDVCVPLSPSPVALVAQVVWDADVEGALDVQPMSAAEVTTALLANTVCAASRSELAFDAAVAVARRTRGVTGRRGESAGALAALADLASADPMAPISDPS